MNTLRWGILSTARIGTQQVIPALQQSEHGTVVAIASRSLERAQDAARELGISRAHGSYEALLADPDVDAVYNPLPNHLHVPWSLKALEAGKHVLCEKPLGLDAADAERLRAAAQAHPGLGVMEAFMYKHHPQWEEAVRLVRTGAIGPLRAVHATFAYYNDDPNNIRNRPDIGGGGLMDVGCYAVSLARLLFGAEPAHVCALMDVDAALGTDRVTSGLLDFGEGQMATFLCATQLGRFQRVQIHGTEGSIEIEVPFNAPPGRPGRLWLRQGREVQEHLTEPANQFAIQADRFADAVLAGRPVPVSLSDAVANMRALDALKASAQDGQWVKVQETV